MYLLGRAEEVLGGDLHGDVLLVGQPLPGVVLGPLEDSLTSETDLSQLELVSSEEPSSVSS